MIFRPFSSQESIYDAGRLSNKELTAQTHKRKIHTVVSSLLQYF